MGELRRELGVRDAVLMGMGSIIGTGIFVSMGVAAGITGPAVIPAIALGAVVALLNGLSSAELAANHPKSGGTYEYGYRFLHPVLGFLAGWLFLAAKSASAATAALGISGYLLSLSGAGGKTLQTALAIAAVAVLTLVVLRGIRSSSRVNAVIVSITLLSLLFFVFAGIPAALADGRENFTPFFGSPASGSASRNIPDFLHAAALMFVAFTGYGRIATLGEEVRNPEKTIPRAILLSLLLILVLYLAVSTVAVASAGAPLLASSAEGKAAPLIAASNLFRVPGAAIILTLGAVTAMTGVVLNLLLGLSRVLLAMGRRADMPVFLGRLEEKTSTPAAAVITVSVFICLLTLTGNVRTTWSFSAFSVLVYYAVTNLAALFLKKEERLFPPWIPAAGLVLCLSLVVFLDPSFRLIGPALIALGLLWFAGAALLKKRR